MMFRLEFGENEKHVLEYQFNQLLGHLVIRVNDQVVENRFRLFCEPVNEIHELRVGEGRAVQVRIEKERGHLFRQKNRVFIDNRLVKSVVGI